MNVIDRLKSLFKGSQAESEESYMPADITRLETAVSAIMEARTHEWWSIFQGDLPQEKTHKHFCPLCQIFYLDLYLLHQPMSDYYGAWRAMEELYKDGKIRAIGVCNFYPERLMDLCVNSKVVPAVNQVETHPFFQQKDAMKNMRELGVQIEAWGPLAEGQKNIFENELLTGIGAKYGKSVAQVILRWNIQRGVVVIPKSVHKERIEENINVFDFQLSDEDMSAIATMDIGHSETIDHFSPMAAKWLNEYKIHD